MTVNTRALWLCATERTVYMPIHVCAPEWLALGHCIWEAVGLITGLEISYYGYFSRYLSTL